MNITSGDSLDGVLLTPCRPQELADLLPEALAGRRVLAPLGPEAERELAMLRPELPVAEPGAAVVVSTSGSTGAPKGAVLSAAALEAAARSTQQVLGRRTWTCPLPTHYVAGLMVLVRAHVDGTRVRMAASDLSDLDPAPGANAISLVPTQLFRALERPEVLQRLRRYTVLLGGAAVDPAVLQQAREAGLDVRTTYGMSETCGGCVWDGEPLPGVEVRLDDQQRIALAGEMVFSGYRLQPELTGQVLQQEAGRRSVLTSDRGELHQGRLRLLGRVDDVVVSGGVNVDLARVQRAVEALAPGSSQVLALPDVEWGRLVVLATTTEHDLAWWREQLSGELGRAALPRRVVRLDVLPRTSSGKIDRQALLRQLA
ncbi:AMP-binding protein [Luteococcus peritonei]|uniref:AMP-binding protein n=1 Tax=Luteococcus peritonei TaxID=88874 RepID=A0ABW4RVV7_9ACTN